MKIIKWLDQYIEEALLVLFSTVMVIVIVFQVFMRISGNSLTWSEELARYCFIWLVYIGISYGVKRQSHISIDVLTVILKGNAKTILLIISNLIFLVFSLFVIYYGYYVASTLLKFGQASPGMGIPMGLIYIATPLGFGLTIIRLMQELVKQIKILALNTKTENSIPKTNKQKENAI